jgi:hypothetical protein
MVHLFEDCNLCAIHAKRVTISEWTDSLSAVGYTRKSHPRLASTLTFSLSTLHPLPRIISRSAQGPPTSPAHPRPRLWRLELLMNLDSRRWEMRHQPHSRQWREGSAGQPAAEASGNPFRMRPMDGLLPLPIIAAPALPLFSSSIQGFLPPAEVSTTDGTRLMDKADTPAEQPRQQAD